MNKLVLDSQSLISEYAIWGISYGDGRNKQDLRFGQYIHNTYHLVPDIDFYTESATDAFEGLYAKLKEYQR